MSDFFLLVFFFLTLISVLLKPFISCRRKSISLSPFSIDDFASVLFHSELEPRCLLLAEIHGCLTNVIATDASRVFGISGAAPVPLYGDAEEEEEEGDEARSINGDVKAKIEEIVEEEKEVEKVKEEEEEDDEDQVVEEEYWALIRKGISHSKRWDRMAKLKSAEGREGWERHMIGAICQVSLISSSSSIRLSSTYDCLLTARRTFTSSTFRRNLTTFIRRSRFNRSQSSFHSSQCHYCFF